jgi:heme/copper-type cytochrome/quinol oxidase subunit 2
LEFFKYLVLLSFANRKDLLFINTTVLHKYAFFYIFNWKEVASNSTYATFEPYKNPNRPLRKGITSMLRLHSTGAVALPIEVRLQILASSRDVIHSWSIPSAGIKIDCVPGYTSHKIMIFLLEGIYWGQCMEICGRYHH